MWNRHCWPQQQFALTFNKTNKSPVTHNNIEHLKIVVSAFILCRIYYVLNQLSIKTTSASTSTVLHSIIICQPQVNLASEGTRDISRRVGACVGRQFSVHHLGYITKHRLAVFGVSQIDERAIAIAILQPVRKIIRQVKREQAAKRSLSLVEDFPSCPCHQQSTPARSVSHVPDTSTCMQYG